MFVLNKIDSDGEKFVLLPGKPTYSVGRLDTDLILKEDLSISRTHVNFHLPQVQGAKLQITDLGSKYGTFLNNGITSNKKMPSKSTASLQVGDKVRFGALSNVWQVTYLNLITTASALTQAQAQELANIIKPLQGTVIPNWTDQCTYLTMNEVSVTVKLLHALLDQKPIVSFEFWRALVKAAKRIHLLEGWPNPENFLPRQPADVDVRWKPERTKLFAGKTFVFMNRKHNDMYGSVVQKAGGICKDLNAGVRKTFLTKTNVIVVQYVPSSQSQATETINNISDILEQAKLRIIPEYEIGMAILHCSIDKYCNPSNKLIGDSMLTTESISETEGLSANSSIIVPNTAERSQSPRITGPTTEVTVPESEINAPTESCTNKPEIVAQSASDKHAKALRDNSQIYTRKRGHAIFIDSSDEEAEQANKKARPSADPKTKHMTVKDNNEVNKKNSNDLGQNAALESPRRSTRGQAALPQNRSKAEIVCMDSDGEDDELFQFNNKKSVTKKAHISLKHCTDQDNAKTSDGKLCAASNEDEEHLFQLNDVGNTKKPLASARHSSKRKTEFVGDTNQDDEELFQFKKKSSTENSIISPRRSTRTPLKPTETNAQSNKKVAPRPLPTVKVNQTVKISVRNFLEKSQTVNDVIKQTAAKNIMPTEPRKRLHLEMLHESDCDDDNLFDFGDTKKVKKSNAKYSDYDDSNDEGDSLFNFKSTSKQNQSDNEELDEDSIETQPFVPNIEKKSKYFVAKPKQLPRKVNVSSWLSCSGLHDIKNDLNVSAEAVQNELKEDTKSFKQENGAEEDMDIKMDHAQWLESIKNGIQVRFCALKIKEHANDETDASASKYSGRKNFKKFVQKSNLRPQQRTLELKRMQLTEGMVSSL